MSWLSFSLSRLRIMTCRDCRRPPSVCRSRLHSALVVEAIFDNVVEANQVFQVLPVVSRLVASDRRNRKWDREWHVFWIQGFFGAAATRFLSHIHCRFSYVGVTTGLMSDPKRHKTWSLKVAVSRLR